MIKDDFKDIISDTYYHDICNYGIEVIPDYIGGAEADSIILDIIECMPVTLSPAQQKGHYPRWIQYADWPVLNNKPMRYVKQWHDGNLYYYLFEDEETGV